MFPVRSVFNKNLLSGLKIEKPRIMRTGRINIRGGCAFCGSKCEKERAKCMICAVRAGLNRFTRTNIRVIHDIRVVEKPVRSTQNVTRNTQNVYGTWEFLSST